MCRILDNSNKIQLLLIQKSKYFNNQRQHYSLPVKVNFNGCFGCLAWNLMSNFCQPVRSSSISLWQCFLASFGIALSSPNSVFVFSTWCTHRKLTNRIGFRESACHKNESVCVSLSRRPINYTTTSLCCPVWQLIFGFIHYKFLYKHSVEKTNRSMKSCESRTDASNSLATWLEHQKNDDCCGVRTHAPEETRNATSEDIR